MAESGFLKTKEDAEKIRNKQLKANDIKEEDRDYFLERRYPAFGNLVPRDVGFKSCQGKMRLQVMVLEIQD